MGEGSIKLKVKLKSAAEGRWIEVDAELDTGSTYNASMSKELASKLGLKSKGEISTRTGKGKLSTFPLKLFS